MIANKLSRKGTVRTHRGPWGGLLVSAAMVLLLVAAFPAGARAAIVDGPQAAQHVEDSCTLGVLCTTTTQEPHVHRAGRPADPGDGPGSVARLDGGCRQRAQRDDPRHRVQSAGVRRPATRAGRALPPRRRSDDVVPAGAGRPRPMGDFSYHWIQRFDDYGGFCGYPDAPSSVIDIGSGLNAHTTPTGGTSRSTTTPTNRSGDARITGTRATPTGRARGRAGRAPGWRRTWPTERREARAPARCTSSMASAGGLTLPAISWPPSQCRCLCW